MLRATELLYFLSRLILWNHVSHAELLMVGPGKLMVGPGKLMVGHRP